MKARNKTVRVFGFVALMAANSILFQNCESQASGPSGAKYDVDQMSFELEQAKEKWLSQKGDQSNYTLKFSATGLAANSGRDLEVHVQNDSVALVTMAPLVEGDFASPDEVINSGPYQQVTVESLFDEIAAGLEELKDLDPSRECPDGIEVISKYHPEKGYPTNFYIYCGEGSGFQVSSLTFE